MIGKVQKFSKEYHIKFVTCISTSCLGYYFTVPKVTITYSARVIGIGSFAYQNIAKVEGHSEKIVTGNVTFSGEGSGEGSVADLEIVKVDGYDAGTKLSGVRFSLRGCKLDPTDTTPYDKNDPEKQCMKNAAGETEWLSLAKDGQDPFYEKEYVTGTNGTLKIDGSDVKIFINDTKEQFRYFLKEIAPIEHYMNLQETYIFSLEEDMAKVDYNNYVYYYTDSFQIKNWPLQGLVVGKSVASTDQADYSRDYRFRVTLFQTDEDGKVVKDKAGNPITDTSVTKKYGDMQFTAGICEFTLRDNEQISAYSMPADIHYKVEEIDENGAVITGESEFKVTYEVTEAEKTPDTGEGAVYTGVTDHEYTLVTFTNTKEQKGSVKVTKAFSGIASLPEEFRITNNVTNDIFTVTNIKGGTGTEEDPYYWVIDDLEIGTEVTFEESGYTLEGYTVTVNGSAAASAAAATAAVTAVPVGFVNEYTKKPGDLELTKVVQGDGADLSKQFEFEIELSAPAGSSLASVYNAVHTGDTGITSVTVSGGKVTGISLKAGDVFTIQGLPAGTTYKITESDYSAQGYSSSIPASGLTGTITGGTTQKESVTVTNTFSAGGLIVEKTISGNAADPEKAFFFEVTFTKSGLTGNHGSYKTGTSETIGSAVPAELTFTSGTATVTFTLKGGEKADFSNLPVGTRFTVSENSKDADGYETTVSSTGGTVNSEKTVTGSISSVAAVTASYVNTKNTVAKEASKQWKSGEEIMAWPADIDTVEFTLYAKIQGSEAPVKISDESVSSYFSGISAVMAINRETPNHKAKWETLPARILDGTEWKDVEYSVRETRITYLKTAEEDTPRVVEKDIPASEGDIIINQAEVTEVHASKAWLNKDNSTTPPQGAEVTFTLLADGKETEHFVKLSGNDATLGGTVQQTGDYEGADWTAYFTDLPRYNTETGALIEYTVKETGIWNGYQTDGSDTAVNGGTITNKEITFSLNILKIDSNDDDIKLEGAGFTLNMIDGTAGADSIIAGTEMKVTTDSDGEAAFSDLSVGYYKVEETQTPDGYVITGESVFYIEVNKDGIALLTKGSGSPDTWEKNAASYGNVKTFTVTSGNAEAEVVNDSGTELPHTGGSGTMIYTVIGALLVGIAGILLLYRKRNELMN